MHVRIRVLDTALTGANLPSGARPPTSFSQVDSALRVALVMASGIFTQAGLEYVVDDSQVITDPTAARDGGVELGPASTLSADETAILSTRSSPENVVYLYVAHHFANSARNLSSAAGRTYTSDNFSISDLTESGIIVARFWGPDGGNPTTGVQTEYRGEPIPHELGHFLLSGINNGGSPDPEHTSETSPNLSRLMCPSLNGFTGVTTTAERTNMWTNIGFSPWIDHF